MPWEMQMLLKFSLLPKPKPNYSMWENLIFLFFRFIYKWLLTEHSPETVIYLYFLK